MTKSLTGLMTEILIAEGVLNQNAIVGELIPDLKGSAFGNATLRQLLNMTTGLAYSEDYSDPNADVWVYSQAASPLPKPPGFEGPEATLNICKLLSPKASTEQRSPTKPSTWMPLAGLLPVPPENRF